MPARLLLLNTECVDGDAEGAGSRRAATDSIAFSTILFSLLRLRRAGGMVLEGMD